MSKAQAEWLQIDWANTQEKVAKLQHRIYAASLDENPGEVVRLQKTLISSFSARLLAVRRVTQDNKGKATAGVDGIKSLEPDERLALAENLKLDGKASPLRRVEIPKPGKKERRPLGIPTMEDRAKQALAKLALEPEWEARFEPNSYGFRPGRSCHDAIQAIELAIRRKPKYVLSADLKGCFDNINQDSLIRKLKTFPIMERQIRAWLKSGVMKGNVFYDTESGTPPGGVISPLLANIALHGFETYISNEFSFRKTRKDQPKGKMKEITEARTIRYADDLLILDEDLEVIKRAKLKTQEWMAEVGLKLNEEKTKICHTLLKVNDEEPGFDFLGFNIRTYEVGETKSNENSNGELLMHKTKVRPSDKSMKRFKTQVKDILRRGHAMKPAEMLKIHNWFVRGWANYFKIGDGSGDYFRKLQDQLYPCYMGWGRKKFSQRGNGYIVKKIFHKSKYSKWNFGWKEGNYTHLATTLYEFDYVKHLKVQGSKSPYDGNWEYWLLRKGDHALCPKDVKIGLKKQKGRCKYCNSPFSLSDNMEVHHIDGNRKNNKADNKCLVHRHCHDAIHRKDAESAKALHLT
jgi:RNA-directed DNA polymerase